ncbi:MAG: Rrf2 family transcriptional regulator [Alphaproteobacteria bacterium]|nr:Rrf2 family transcriptional regulator [Alphaproteobacteria bacterium]
MILGTKARYAVMAMVDLAGRDSAAPVTLAGLADSQEITLPYLEQIFSKLKQAGLVTSVRGPGGGYVLANSSDKITIAQIVEAVEESIQMTRCAKESGGCMSSKAKCLTHDLWDGLGKQIHDYLSGITLADVRGQKNVMPAKAGIHAC